MKLVYCSLLSVAFLQAHKEEDLAKFRATGDGTNADLSGLALTADIAALKKANKPIVLTLADLTDCDFSGADLSGINLGSVNKILSEPN